MASLWVTVIYVFWVFPSFTAKVSVATGAPASRAAALAVEEPERLQSLTQEFYPEVGRRCRCTWNCAERSLRTATAQAWECNGALISELAMRKITQPPTAGDFLCILRHALLQKKNTEA